MKVTKRREHEIPRVLIGKPKMEMEKDRDTSSRGRAKKIQLKSLLKTWSPSKHPSAGK